MSVRSARMTVVWLAAVAATVLVLRAGALCIPQWQANTQVRGRVNNEVYGNTGGTVRYGQYSSQPITSQPLPSQPYSSRPYSSQASLWRPQSSQPMPSELRHLYVVSGATPSEVRMKAAQVGPLPAPGPVAYIPQRPNSSGPPPAPKGDNRVDPSVAPGTPLTSPITASAAASPPTGAGAIRYPSVTQGPIDAKVTPQPLSNSSYVFAPAPATGSPPLATDEFSIPSWDQTFGATSPAAGSIRYGGNR